jgi:integrase
MLRFTLDSAEAFLAWAAEKDPFRKGADLFTGKRGHRQYSATTVEGWRYLLRAYVTALTEKGIPSDSLTSLGDLVQVERAKQGLRRLVERSPSGDFARALRTACMLKVIGHDYLRLHPDRVEELADLCHRLTKRREGLTAKNRERLAPLDDERLRWRLLVLPGRLMRRALATDDGSRRAALTAQMAVTIELLLMTVMRVGNLVRLRLDRHFISGSGGDGPTHLVIPGEEVKNGRPLEFRLPQEIRRLLALYCNRFRPRLAAPGAPWLFPGQDGLRHKCRVILAGQITRTVREELGIDMHPHLFRHFAANLYLEQNPGGYETVRRLLGHASYQTTIRSYVGAEATAAVRHYDQMVLRLREPARPRGER